MAMHPNPSGPIRAESPYTRKLKRLNEDLAVVLAIAPSHQKEDVHALMLQVDMLIAGL